MAQPIILITFYCRTGDTEKVALEAAVGAVQARGLIRLRRLPDLDPGFANEDLARMRKEYVAPAEKDVAGADTLLLVTSPDFPLSSPEWKPYLELLDRLRDAGKLRGKFGAGIGVSNSILSGLGLTCACDEQTTPPAVGRAAVACVQARKAIEDKERS